GKPLQLARTGFPLWVRVILHAERPVRRPEVEVTFHDLDGRVLSVVSTRARGIEIDVVDGTRSLLLDVDSLPLAEGSYEVSVGVRDESGQRELDMRSRI